jgi:protein-S-isoprenylcysteine O-methyltransferase Ste14
VVVGLYQYVRNPMYLGFFFGWLGLWVIFGRANRISLAIALTAVLATAAFVMLYEEPTLRKAFGPDYDQYCANVPRWLPRMHAWRPPQV